ncbi:MAG: sigma-70 family RNA polymerase sigma factor [Elusimicrobiota bacterium]
MTNNDIGSLGDAELLSMAKDGSTEAMEIIIKRYQEPLYNFAIRMTGNRHSAEDVTQESFLRAIKSLPYYRHKNFRNYIYKIASNLIIDRYRKKEPVVSIDDPFLMHSSNMDDNSITLKDVIPDIETSSPDYIVQKKLMKQKISDAIAGMPEEQRRVFSLRVFSGLSFREISEICGCSLNTALGRMHYAVEKIRKFLESREMTREKI